MKPSTKISSGAIVIAATVFLEFISWMIFRFRLSNPPTSSNLEDFVIKQQERHIVDSIILGVMQMSWLPILVGILLMSFGIYQTARMVEKLTEDISSGRL